MYLSLSSGNSQRSTTLRSVSNSGVRARTNRLKHIRPLAAELLERLSGAVAGELTIVGT